MLDEWKKAIEEWEKVVDAFEKEEIIQCNVLKKVKGGFKVRLSESIHWAFLAASQAPFEYQNPEEHIGTDIPVKVIKLGRHRSVVVSGNWAKFKLDLDPEIKTHEADWHRIVEAYKNKSMVQATVIDVTEQDLRVKIGGIEASLPEYEIEVLSTVESIGETMELRITSVGLGGFSVSRRRILANEPPIHRG